MDTVEITRFIIHCKHKEDIIRGDSSEVPVWRFPEICACCGDLATGIIKKKLKAGNISIREPIKIPYCSTCIAHIKKRLAELTITATIIILFTIITFLAAVHYQSAGGNVADRLKEPIWMEFIVSFVSGFIIGGMYFLSRRSQLPQTSSCTVPLKLNFGTPSSKLFSGVLSGETFLQIEFICANSTFADRFRKINKDILASETKLKATFQKTNRGDLKIKFLK